ncbi:MAG: TIGR00341 family protein [Muribaculaceae bacterium]|nr:TIGR00341 family protein [Muribaculaceae bacterium]
MKEVKANIATRFSEFFVNYFSLSGQLVSQEEAERSIRDGVSFRGTNILILILAIFIASLGLNTNSTAVIIGAMLISPLMGPIIGMGLGVGIHDFELIKRCVRNLVMAAGFSVIASTVYFLISPVNEQHSELLARTSPTIYDVLIGFVGGGAGIIALGSTNKGNVIPGVAIATALMPPLCTAGYGLATWQLNYFFGAFYLFIINSIYIAFATFIGVKLMKYKGVESADEQRAKRMRRVVYTLAILTMLPSIYLTYNMLKDNKFVMSADSFIHNECQFADTQVLNRKAYYDHGQKYLTITLIGRTIPADSLLLTLEPKLKFYGLAGTHLSFIQGGMVERGPENNTQAVSDIYTLAQGTISRQQVSIDSLSRLLAEERASINDAPQIAPEVKVLFPKLTKIGISTSVFSELHEDGCDTLTVALIESSGKFTIAERERLAKYLEARLDAKKVKIVEL